MYSSADTKYSRVPQSNALPGLFKGPKICDSLQGRVKKLGIDLDGLLCNKKEAGSRLK